MIDLNADLPTDRTALAAERLELVTRGAEITATMSALTRNDAERPRLVDEKTLIDRRLKRLNVALRAANVAATNSGELPALAQGRSPPPAKAPTRREEHVLAVTCAILSGPLAPRYGTKRGGIDHEALVDDAEDIVGDVLPASDE